MTITPLLHRQETFLQKMMMIRSHLHLIRHCPSLLGTVTEEREKQYQSGQRISTRHWSYSLRGKKGKMPLLGTAVGSTIKQAIMKWKPGLEEKEVELLMAEVLKHAPSAHSKSLKGRMERQAEEHPQN
ncbi:unnamed protein product [Arctogadus glacialis]